MQKELEEGLQVLIDNDIDLIIVEVSHLASWHPDPQYFHNIREMEWAIELALRFGKPVAATMCMGGWAALALCRPPG